MTALNQFELHALLPMLADELPAPALADDPVSPLAEDIEQLPWQEGQASCWQTPLAIAESDGDVLVASDPASGLLTRVDDESQAQARFRIVHRKLGMSLAMLPQNGGVTVNGLPALPLAILSPRDLLSLVPGCHVYVTERVRPHVGAPTPEMLGQKCPYCRVPIDKDTRVVSHRCGAIYHHETAESHPQVPEKDRLNCFTEIRGCLSCNRPVTLEEFLVWDPATL